MTYNLTPEQVAELWDGYAAGQTVSQLARRFGKRQASMYQRIQASGGIRPTLPRCAARHLSFEDREEISRGLVAGHSLRQIAVGLGRSPSTISREVKANGGRSRYRAGRADRACEQRRRRPKVCKLAASPQLQAMVAAKLEQRWSPEQIAGWLKRANPDDPELQVSHETIYRTLYVQSRGALKRELTEHLRTKRRIRRPGNGNRQRASGSGNLVGMVHISQRPAEAEDRAVPGHWEGDLILGKGMSAIGTLVERSTRFLLLIHLERIKSEHVVAELTRHVQTLPDQLRRSVTWDQGKEMANGGRSRYRSATVVAGCSKTEAASGRPLALPPAGSAAMMPPTVTPAASPRPPISCATTNVTMVRLRSAGMWGVAAGQCAC